MAQNGNGSFDGMTSWARLSERVENQGKDIVDLRSNMNTGFQTLNSAIGTLSNELRTNSKTQWPVIWSAAGVCSAALIAAGTFFYSTLDKGITRIDVNQSKLAENALSIAAFTDWKSSYENNRVVARQDYIDKFSQVNTAIGKINDAIVPRAELERVWRDQDKNDAYLQQQIDEIVKRELARNGRP